MENLRMITEKQLNYLLVLGAKKEDVIGLNIREAGKMIGKLKNKAKEPKKAEIKREHPYKVGDVFAMSWGYEQTNYNFFVITELVGSKSVRLKECGMDTIKKDYYSHGMARDVSYDPKTALPLERSMWIKDQEEKGDLHRITKGYDNQDLIVFESRYYAYKYDGETCFESWYY